MLHRNAALLLLVATLGSGCTLVEIEATLEETCLTYNELEIEVPPVIGGGDVEHSFEFTDLGGLEDLAEIDADVHFVRFAAHALSGIESFDFVEAATITVRPTDPESDLEPLIAYHCAGTCDTAGGTIEIPAPADVDALEYLGEDALAVDLKLTGQVPAQTFTMSADLCFEGRLSYSLEP
jgi:hypothetical protein